MTPDNRWFGWMAVVVMTTLQPACDKAPATGDEWRLATEEDSSAQPCERPPARSHTADTLIIIDQPSEFPCEIVELPVSVTLKAESDTLPDPSNSVVRTRSGRFITTVNSRSGEVLWWDTDGSFLGAYGSTGEGPGEFTTMGEHLLYTGPGDTLYVVDGRNRWSVFDEKMNYVRSFVGQHGGRHQAGTTVTDRGLILTTGHTIVDSRSNSFHLMDLEGELIRSFGGPPQAANLDKIVYVRRASGYSGGDTFWVAPINEAPSGMVLEQWTLDGRHVRTIRRNAPWLPNDGFPPSNDGMAVPAYLFVTVDEQGLLWVVVAVPDPEWEGAAGQDEGMRPDQMTDDFFRERLDAWVEVIDPDAGRVLASSRIDAPGPFGPFVGHFPGTRGFYRVLSDDLGFNTIEVFEAALQAKDR